MRYALAGVVVLWLATLTVAAPDSGKNDAFQPTLSDLAWMVGDWHGQGLGGDVEEHWGVAAGGTMIGAFRLVANEKVRVIEYLMITQDTSRIVYRFKHFMPDFTTWEKEGPLEFTLISVSPGVAIFHSDVPDQHSPRRLTYRLLDSRNLSVTVSGSNAEGELDDSFEIRFTRP